MKEGILLKHLELHVNTPTHTHIDNKIYGKNKQSFVDKVHLQHTVEIRLQSVYRYISWVHVLNHSRKEERKKNTPQITT